MRHEEEAAVAEPRLGIVIKVAGLCFLFMFFDGWDFFGISYVSLEMSKVVGFAPDHIGYLFSAAATGFMVGSFIMGIVTDKIGRKLTLVGCAVIFSLASLGTAYSPNYETVLLFRFLCGLGMGGVWPSVSALTTEYSPKKYAGTAVILVNMGMLIGGASSGFFTAAMGNGGWRTLFLVGGYAPLLLALVAWVFLPESMAFLGRKRELAQVRETSRAGGTAGPVSPASQQFPVTRLFTEGLASFTLLIWMVSMLSLGTIAFHANWLPTLLQGIGLDMHHAAGAVALGQIGGLIGTLLASWLVIRCRPFVLLAIAFTVVAVVLFVCSQLPAVMTYWITAGVFLSSFLAGAQVILAAAVAVRYPAAFRGTAVGWAWGIGRIGAIVCPLIITALMRSGWTNGQLFSLAALAPLLAGLLCWIISRQRPAHAAEA